MRHSLGILVAASALVLTGAGPSFAQSLSDLHSQRVEGGRVCMSDHFHHGSSSGQPNRAAAERSAIENWSGFTAWEYGNNWGSWRIAGSRKVECSQSGSGWACSVEARPCRPQIGGRAKRS